MLQLRPTCEHCNTALPPHSPEAMICSFECTFCRSCVDQVLHNVCPTCAGGFVPRPVRPATAWNNGLSVATRPATTSVTHQPVDPDRQRALVARVGQLPPAER
jgi:hypothetical protein